MRSEEREVLASRVGRCEVAGLGHRDAFGGLDDSRVPSRHAAERHGRRHEGLSSVGWPIQSVKAGDILCMVEAMKMENVLVAERDVTIKKILADEGDSLAVDAVIMEFV